MGLFEHFPYTNFHDLNLDWILKVVKDLYYKVSNQEEWINEHKKEYEELKEFMDAIEAGDLPDAVYDKLKLWLINNYESIMSELIKFISFSLNDAGYLVVTYPDSLDELIFNTTGLDIFPALQPEYGHLTISY